MILATKSRIPCHPEERVVCATKDLNRRVIPNATNRTARHSERSPRNEESLLPSLEMTHD